jgi:RNA polymerase sigma-70 factor (ECF subfamily)
MNAEIPELVQRCLEGDAAAWTKLVKEYKGIVYSICKSFSVNPEDADDLAQEVFLKIWMNLASYNPRRGGLTSWIASITHNLRVDRFRGSRLQRSMESLDGSWDEANAAAPDLQVIDARPSPHDSAFNKEVAAILSRAADEIPPAMREALTLRFVAEIDYREMSRRLQVPEGTVKSRVNRGRSQLAYILRPMRAALGVP